MNIDVPQLEMEAIYCRVRQLIANDVAAGKLDRFVSSAAEVPNVLALAGGYVEVVEALDDWLFTGPFAHDDVDGKARVMGVTLRGSHSAEFPNLPVDVEIPFAFEDTSWHNNACPSFVRGCYTLWVEHADRDMRECGPDVERYILQLTDDEGSYIEDLFGSEAYQPMLDFIRTLPPCREQPGLEATVENRRRRVEEADARTAERQAAAQAFQGAKRFVQIRHVGRWTSDAGVTVDHTVEWECVITGVSENCYDYEVVAILGEVGRPPWAEPMKPSGARGSCLKNMLDNVRWIKE